MAKRRDVVNKTILRSIRRYYTFKFKEIICEKIDTKDNNSKNYFKNIKVLCKHLFHQEIPNYSQIEYFIASIIAPKYIDDEILGDFDGSIEELNAFYNCLYKYSHSKLVNLFFITPLSTIYEDFYNNGREIIFEKEQAIIKNQELYEAVLKDFQRFFETDDIDSICVT